jgi:hypothetical protein
MNPASPPAAEWECFDIFFGFPEVRELRAGVLDHDAEHVFTSGHCHSFAEAIRRLASAAELVFAFDFHGEDETEPQGHVLVRIGGRYLDASGWVDERLEAEDGNRAFEREWDRVLAIGPQGWLEHASGWLVPRFSDALPFAEALLVRLGVPLDGGSEAESETKEETDDRSQRGRRAARRRCAGAPGQGADPADRVRARQR